MSIKWFIRAHDLGFECTVKDYIKYLTGPLDTLYTDFQVQNLTCLCLIVFLDLILLQSWLKIFWNKNSNFRPLSKFYYMLFYKKLRCEKYLCFWFYLLNNEPVRKLQIHQEKLWDFFPPSLIMERRQASVGVYYAMKRNPCQYFPTRILRGGTYVIGWQKSSHLTYLAFHTALDMISILKADFLPHLPKMKRKQNQDALHLRTYLL